MSNPKIAQKAPFVMEIKPGKYAWCSCGESANQPYCDGAHKGTGFSPTVFVAEESKDVHFCTCKQTDREMGLCNGAHKAL